MVVTIAGCGAAFTPPTEVARLDSSAFPVDVTTRGATDDAGDVRMQLCHEPATRRSRPDYAFELTEPTRVRIVVVGDPQTSALALVMTADMRPVGCGAAEQEVDLDAGQHYVYLLGRLGRSQWPIHLERVLTGDEADRAQASAEIERRARAAEEGIEGHRTMMARAIERYQAREEQAQSIAASAAEPTLRMTVSGGRCYHFFVVLPPEMDARTATITLDDHTFPFDHGVNDREVDHCMERAGTLVVTIPPMPESTRELRLFGYSISRATIAREERAQQAFSEGERRRRTAEFRRDPAAGEAACSRCGDELVRCARTPRVTRAGNCESLFRSCRSDIGLTEDMCHMPTVPGAR